MADDSDEPDRLAGFAHPREAKALIGHAAAQAEFLGGLRAGKLHHAWLIGGAEGIGKATFAYQTAKLLLGLGRGPAPEGARYRIDPAAQASRLVETRAHPDLAVLKREYEPEKKKVPTVISVDATRRTLELFGGTASAAGWRVCIVDCAEDLNIASANTLLKMLEEPPPRSIFLIISHQPQQVLPTIRSRCRKLALAPLTDAEVRQVVEAAEPEATPGDIARAVGLAQGAPRRAFARLDPEVIALIDGARALLNGLPRVDIGAVLGLGEAIAARRATEAEFNIFLEAAQDWMSDTLRASAHLPPARLAPLAEVWEKVSRAARETDVLNLDRRPLVLSIFTDLASAVTRMRMG
jgi:DNA polymerase III subunit delta'